MHNELWKGAELKVQNAEFFLERMSQALAGPERTQKNAALQATGAISDTGWQRAIYAYFDAFLAMTRSVPEIVNACFGHDLSNVMTSWFNALDGAEQTRRNMFTAAFNAKHKAFQKLPLSKARNTSLHRIGVAPVTVLIEDVFGVPHGGSPTKRVPIASSRPSEMGGGLPWESSAPLLPDWQDFAIDGKPLFEECRKYLESARTLVEDGRAIAKGIHSNNALTPPP